MTWLSVSIITDASHAEPLADALGQRGAFSTSIEDADAGTDLETPQFDEPGEIRPIEAIGWSRSRIAALFEPCSTDRLRELVSDAALAAGLTETPSFSVEPLEEQDWVRLSQAQFEPIRISDRLWIVPSWHVAPNPDALSIELDPGLAFGTGSHPTTHLCLQWLEANVTPGVSVLDYGCGSGILAIAAGKLGASEIHGVDIDPHAINAARHNSQNNQIQADYSLADKPIGDKTYDLVVANILANPLRAMAPALCNHVRPGGGLALSGILVEQAEEIATLYAPWATLTVFGEHDGWVCLAGVRHGEPS